MTTIKQIFLSFATVFSFNVSCNAYGCGVDWSRSWYCEINNTATGGKAGIGKC